MLRGTTKFVCDNCGNKFVSLDVEYMATTLSAPIKCPQCGSYHTMPGGIFSRLQKPLYVKIWNTIDKQQN